MTRGTDDCESLRMPESSLRLVDLRARLAISVIDASLGARGTFEIMYSAGAKSSA
jgi:hypothetical protein